MSWYAPGSGSGILVTPPIASGSGGINPGANLPSSTYEAFMRDPIGSAQNAFETYQTGMAQDNFFHNLDDQTKDQLVNLSTHAAGSSAQDHEEIENAANMYLSLYNSSHDPAYLEKYIDSILEQQNTAAARNWEEYMSNSQFTRMVKDIESAGYNPWLALQSGLGQSSVPSTSAAGTSGINASSQANSRVNNLVGRGISAIALIIIAAMKLFGA